MGLVRPGRGDLRGHGLFVIYRLGRDGDMRARRWTTAAAVLALAVGAFSLYAAGWELALAA